MFLNVFSCNGFWNSVLGRTISSAYTQETVQKFDNFFLFTNFFHTLEADKAFLFLPQGNNFKRKVQDRQLIQPQVGLLNTSIFPLHNIFCCMTAVELQVNFHSTKQRHLKLHTNNDLMERSLWRRWRGWLTFQINSKS